MDGRRQNRGQQIEEGPQRTEDKLNLQPGYLVELLQDVEQVEAEQDTGEPERDHGNPAEEGTLASIAQPRALYTDEA